MSLLLDGNNTLARKQSLSMSKKTGRPEAQIDKRIFEAIMGIPFVTYSSACEVLGVSQSTLQRWVHRTYGKRFEQVKAEKLEGMKLKLMGKQYELAMKGNVPLLIFLGKNLLGQSDKQEISGNSEKPLSLSYTKEQLKDFVGKK